MKIRDLLFRLLARLPLPAVHLVGALFGLLGLLWGRRRRKIADNLRRAGLYSRKRLLLTGMELGKGLVELVPIWLRPLAEVTAWVREVRGWEHVDAARRAGRGVIVFGPHLGCLELAGLTIAARMPITALYRRPRQDWAHAMMQAGRNRGQAHMVEPNLGGVRALLTALKRNGAAWVLPDQRANRGEGAWADYFGRPAYMPTLLYRLAGASGAPLLLFWCERLPRGRGYRLVIEPLPELPGETGPAMALVNRALEDRVRRLPEQYLWTYDVHRRRRGEVPTEAVQA